MIPWNHCATTEALKKRGVLHELQGASFTAHVMFTSNTPGFIVQQITKETELDEEGDLQQVPLANKRRSKVKETLKTIKNTPVFTYYEIFWHDGKNTCKYAMDTFGQTELPPESSGIITIIGTADFYPYSENVEFTSTTQLMKISKKLKTIFGAHITRYGVKDANGLPSGINPPNMNGLHKEGPTLVHKLTSEWETTDEYPSVTDELYTKNKNGQLKKVTKFKRAKTFKQRRLEDFSNC